MLNTIYFLDCLITAIIFDTFAFVNFLVVLGNKSRRTTNLNSKSYVACSTYHAAIGNNTTVVHNVSIILIVIDLRLCKCIII